MIYSQFVLCKFIKFMITALHSNYEYFPNFHHKCGSSVVIRIIKVVKFRKLSQFFIKLQIFSQFFLLELINIRHFFNRPQILSYSIFDKVQEIIVVKSKSYSNCRSFFAYTTMKLSRTLTKCMKFKEKSQHFSLKTVIIISVFLYTTAISRTYYGCFLNLLRLFPELLF